MNFKEKFTKLKESMDRWLWKLVGKDNETRTPSQGVAMYFKEKFPKMKESVDRWLWKLVGQENDILFHSLRILLAFILLAVLVVLALGIVAALWKAVLILVDVIIVVAPYVLTIAVVVGIVALIVFLYRQEEQRKLRESERQAELDRQQGERNAELHRQEAEKARLQELADAPRRQQYLKAIADAKAEPDKPKIWHCAIGEKQHGPMLESMVQKWIDDGALGKDDHVRVEGCTTWIRLSDIPERFHLPIQAGAVRGAIAQVVDSNTVRCPKCGCTQLSTDKKGMDAGGACCGALLLGPLGLLCGLQGANAVVVTCLKCGHQWTRGKG